MSGQAQDQDRIQRLLRPLDVTWTAFQASYAGLPGARLTEPGVTGDWSVKDIIAHITTWEEESLTHLPVILAGGRPPRYASYGGLDAFNALMAERKRNLSLFEVLRQQDETHDRLLAFVRAMPADQLAGDSRARRRLRLDTYGHYPLHAAAIRAWRTGTAPGQE